MTLLIVFIGFWKTRGVNFYYKIGSSYRRKKVKYMRIYFSITLYTSFFSDISVFHPG